MHTRPCRWRGFFTRARRKLWQSRPTLRGCVATQEQQPTPHPSTTRTFALPASRCGRFQGSTRRSQPDRPPQIACHSSHCTKHTVIRHAYQLIRVVSSSIRRVGRLVGSADVPEGEHRVVVGRHRGQRGHGRHGGSRCGQPVRFNGTETCS